MSSCAARLALLCCLVWLLPACRAANDAPARSPALPTARDEPRYVELDRPTIIPTGLDEPRDIVFVSPSSCYVLGADELVRLEIETGNRTSLALAHSASALAADRETLYLVGRDFLGTLDLTEGDADLQWTPGPGRGQWTGAAVVGGRLHGADWLNMALVDLSAPGRPVARKLVDGALKPARFMAPSPYLTVRSLPLGGFLMNSPGEHRLVRFSASGNESTRFGQAGTGPGGWCGCCNPVDFDVDRNGRVATAEKGCRRIQLFEADGGRPAVLADADVFEDDRKTCDLRGIDPVNRWLKVRFAGEQELWVLERCTGDLRRLERTSEVSRDD